MCRLILSYTLQYTLLVQRASYKVHNIQRLVLGHYHLFYLHYKFIKCWCHIYMYILILLSPSFRQKSSFRENFGWRKEYMCPVFIDLTIERGQVEHCMIIICKCLVIKSAFRDHKCLCNTLLSWYYLWLTKGKHTSRFIIFFNFITF